MSPLCFPVVFQMLFPICHLVSSRLCCRCGLPTISQVVPDMISQFSPNCFPLHTHNAQFSPRFSLPPIISQLLSNRFRAASRVVFQLSSNCTVSLGLELETVNADGLQSWVNCVWLSGCLSLPVCVSVCLLLWLLVSDSPDFSCYGTCFQVCLHVHWSLFNCLPVWLSTASGVRLSRCLCALVPSLVSHFG